MPKLPLPDPDRRIDIIKGYIDLIENDDLNIPSRVQAVKDLVNCRRFGGDSCMAIVIRASDIDLLQRLIGAFAQFITVDASVQTDISYTVTTSSSEAQTSSAADAIKLEHDNYGELKLSLENIIFEAFERAIKDNNLQVLKAICEIKVIRKRLKLDHALFNTLVQARSFDLIKSLISYDVSYQDVLNNIIECPTSIYDNAYMDLVTDCELPDDLHAHVQKCLHAKLAKALVEHTQCSDAEGDDKVVYSAESDNGELCIVDKDRTPAERFFSRMAIEHINKSMFAYLCESTRERRYASKEKVDAREYMSLYDYEIKSVVASNKRKKSRPVNKLIRCHRVLRMYTIASLLEMLTMEHVGVLSEQLTERLQQCYDDHVDAQQRIDEFSQVLPYAVQCNYPLAITGFFLDIKANDGFSQDKNYIHNDDFQYGSTYVSPMVKAIQDNKYDCAVALIQGQMGLVSDERKIDVLISILKVPGVVAFIVSRFRDVIYNNNSTEKTRLDFIAYLHQEEVVPRQLLLAMLLECYYSFNHTTEQCIEVTESLCHILGIEGSDLQPHQLLSSACQEEMSAGQLINRQTLLHYAGMYQLRALAVAYNQLGDAQIYEILDGRKDEHGNIALKYMLEHLPEQPDYVQTYSVIDNYIEEIYPYIKRMYEDYLFSSGERSCHAHIDLLSRYLQASYYYMVTKPGINASALQEYLNSFTVQQDSFDKMLFDSHNHLPRKASLNDLLPHMVALLKLARSQDNAGQLYWQFIKACVKLSQCKIESQYLSSYQVDHLFYESDYNDTQYRVSGLKFAYDVLTQLEMQNTSEYEGSLYTVKSLAQHLFLYIEDPLMIVENDRCGSRIQTPVIATLLLHSLENGDIVLINTLWKQHISDKSLSHSEKGQELIQYIINRFFSSLGDNSISLLLDSSKLVDVINKQEDEIKLLLVNLLGSRLLLLCKELMLSAIGSGCNFLAEFFIEKYLSNTDDFSSDELDNCLLYLKHLIVNAQQVQNVRVILFKLMQMGNKVSTKVVDNNDAKMTSALLAAIREAINSQHTWQDTIAKYNLYILLNLYSYFTRQSSIESTELDSSQENELNKVLYESLLTGLSFICEPYDILTQVLGYMTLQQISSLFSHQLETMNYNYLYVLASALPSTLGHDDLASLLDSVLACPMNICHEKNPSSDDYYTYINDVSYDQLSYTYNYLDCVAVLLLRVSDSFTISRKALRALLSNGRFNCVQLLIDKGISFKDVDFSHGFDGVASLGHIKNLVYHCRLPSELLLQLINIFQQKIVDYIAKENYIERCVDVAIANRASEHSSAYEFMTIKSEQYIGDIGTIRAYADRIKPKHLIEPLVPTKHVSQCERVSYIFPFFASHSSNECESRGSHEQEVSHTTSEAPSTSSINGQESDGVPLNFLESSDDDPVKDSHLSPPLCVSATQIKKHKIHELYFKNLITNNDISTIISRLYLCGFYGQPLTPNSQFNTKQDLKSMEALFKFIAGNDIEQHDQLIHVLCGTTNFDLLDTDTYRRHLYITPRCSNWTLTSTDRKSRDTRYSRYGSGRHASFCAVRSREPGARRLEHIIQIFMNKGDYRGAEIVLGYLPQDWLHYWDKERYSGTYDKLVRHCRIDPQQDSRALKSYGSSA